MPKAKTNHGKAKTISCPRCGKKFCSETSVLQHMNQPTSLCHVLWHEEHAHSLHQHFKPHSSHFMEEETGGIPKTETNFFPEGCWMPPGDQDDNNSHSDKFRTAGNPLDKFTETYKVCGEVYPGGRPLWTFSIWINMLRRGWQILISPLLHVKSGNLLLGFCNQG